MFRKNQEPTATKPSTRPIDALLDKAIQNYQLDEAKRLLRTCDAKVTNPDHLLDVIFGDYNEPEVKKSDLTYRYKNRTLNPSPTMSIQHIIYGPFGGPPKIEILPPGRETVINEIRPWIQFAIEAGCTNAQHRIWGDTMLMWAVANKDKHSINQLIAAHANLSIKNNLDQTVVNVANYYGDEDIIDTINNALIQERLATHGSKLRCRIL